MNVVRASQNRLAHYLVTDGAANMTRLVLVRSLFGMVRQLWRLAMSLGSVDKRFQVISEDVFDSGRRRG